LTDTGDDLRATSEAIAADADRLRAIEERKQGLPEGHPELVDLSAQAEGLARGIVSKTVAEHELADEQVGESA
jgi:hypothetical protein